jgi:hypothetical protein
MRADELTAGGALGTLVAAGPRAAAQPADYAWVFDSVLDGYLLHYGPPARSGIEDPDQRLLHGDLAYALGLARLADVGDLEAIAELADLISLCAQVHTEGRAAASAGPDALPATLWALAALAVGTGPWPEHLLVKDAVRAGSSEAPATAVVTARSRAAGAGIESELNSALIAFREMDLAPPKVSGRGHLDG